jgi:hypothetical protein
MPGNWLRGTMTAIALVAVFGVVGVVGFVATRDDAPPVTTTTTTTTDPRPEFIEGIAAALVADERLPLGPEQAACVATALYDGLGERWLATLIDQPDPLASLPEGARLTALRSVVTCVPPEVAEALLSGSTTTIAVSGLPDEGA